jgi:DNA-binding NtrC family response regulator
VTRDPVRDTTTTTKVLPTGGDTTPSLLVFSGSAPHVVPLQPGPGIVIGRGGNADVVLDDESISRQHARFRLNNGAIEVTDLESSNGTSVRGVRLTSGASATVGVGDAVELGAALIVIQSRTGSVANRLRPAAAASPHSALVTRVADSDVSVLLLGETGVGKEVMTELLHAGSPRRDGPLVKLNCAALMTSVLESELFGHERGAFTGAIKDKPGLIESADGGTLFLDEIGEADGAVQIKLLRVLEARETMRVGALRPRTVDVRFIAATNRSPAEQIQAGKLRPDLYYRIAGFTLTIPPLRERRADIPALVQDLLARHPKGGGVTLSPQAISALQRHDWPGNVRELRNVLDRVLVIGDGTIGVRDIQYAMQLEPMVATQSTSPAPTGDDPERERVLATLESCGGNQTLAAQQLGISRRTLVYWLQAWGLTRPRRR